MTKQEDYLGADSLSDLQQQFATALKEQTVGTLAEFLQPLEIDLDIQSIIKLIAVEMEYRRSFGELISWKDFYDDFPQLIQYDMDQTVTMALDESTALLTAIFRMIHQLKRGD